MSFQPRIYGSSGVGVGDFNLLPWVVTDNEGEQKLAGGAKLSREFTRPMIGEFLSEGLFDLFGDEHVHIAHIEPVSTDEGIIYVTIFQEVKPLVEEED